MLDCRGARRPQQCAEIPWGGKRLIVGGAHGALPVMDEVLAEAKGCGIEVIVTPTVDVCQVLEEVKKGQALRHPALHVLTAESVEIPGIAISLTERRNMVLWCCQDGFLTHVHKYL